jgi:hypothetical protein
MAQFRMARARLVWLFARRCLLYNVALSLLGAGAVFAVSLATAAPDLPLAETAQRALGIAAPMAAALVVTGGQALALIAMTLFHGRELPYYRNAGLGAPALALGSWAIAAVIGSVLFVLGLVWT